MSKVDKNQNKTTKTNSKKETAKKVNAKAKTSKAANEKDTKGASKKGTKKAKVENQEASKENHKEANDVRPVFSFETDESLFKRIQYGVQLSNMMALAKKTAEEVNSEIPYVSQIFANKRLPNIEDEFVLMRTYGYIPVMFHENIKTGELKDTAFLTQYSLLSEVLKDHNITITDLQVMMQTNGIPGASVPRTILRGNNTTYITLNQILAVLNERLHVRLVKVTRDMMEAYVKSLELVFRDQGVFDRRVKALIDAPQSSFYSFTNGEAQDGAKKSRKRGTTKKDFTKLDRVRFANEDNETGEDLQTVLSKYGPKVAKSFASMNITSLEVANSLAGKDLKFIVTFDEDFISKKHKVSWDGEPLVAYGISMMMEMICDIIYGEEGTTFLSSYARQIYLGESNLGISYFNRFLKAHGAYVTIVM